MKYSIQAGLIALQHPEQLKADFMRALNKALETHNMDLRVAKNFTGDGFAQQQLSVVGQKEITFEVLANGEKTFPQGEHFQMQRFRLYTGASAILEDTLWIPGTEDPFLLNAEFDVVSNGIVIQRNVPLASLTRAEEQPFSGYLDWLDPKFWFAQTNLQIVVKAKKTITTTNLNVRWEISGPKLIS